MNHDIQSIIDKYTVEVEAFDIELPDGEVLTFSPFASKDDYDAFIKRAADFYTRATGEGSPIAAMFGDYAPKTAQSAVYALMISERSVSPKITQLQACQMLRAPFLADAIIKRIESESKTLESVWMAKAIAQAKKGSEAMEEDSEGTSSSQVSEPSESTQTD